MKKYNEEYFSVINTKNGKKIADCGDEMDAIMLVSFDSQNRTYTRNKFLMSPVIDIEIPKQLPTSNIVVSNVTENGCSPRKNTLSDAGPLKLKPDVRVPIKAK